MRWKINKSKPKEGDTRIIQRWLLFPKCLHNECRWLERAYIVQECKRIYSYEYDYYEWVDREWKYNCGRHHGGNGRPGGGIAM